MSREGVMITKLKEGLQEALVFLRQLGDFKIPAVMERRRKGLLDKLVELQGDTFRGDSAPKDSSKPSPEPQPQSPAAKVQSPEPEKKKEEKEEEEPAVRSRVTSPSRDSITSPSKRLSRGDSKISALVGNYEHITTLAKKEEEAETPKRFVQLKKVAKPSDFPDTDKGKVEEEEEEGKEKEELKPAAPKEVEKVTEKKSLTPQPSPQLRRKGKENGGLKTERPSSTVSEESANTEAAEEEQVEEEGDDQAGGEKESGKKKGKFGRGLKKIGKLGKLKPKKQKSGRDKSPSRAVEDEDEKSGASEAEEGEHKEEVDTPELEEGVKISGMLERKVATRFKSKWVKVSVKLKDNVLHIGEKEKVELAGYLVTASDVGFDMVNDSTQNKIQFRMDEGENGKERWVEALSAAIEECTPEQEEPAEEPAVADSSLDVPSITIEQPPSSSPVATPQTPTHEDTPTLKKKKALGVSKPAKKLPEQGVEMKGYIYRKKPGLGTRWEKTYSVLTYQAMYFTTMQDNVEYNHMLSLMGDAQKTLSEKKGHDKNSKGINLKLGSKKEQLSFDSSDFDQWKSALERVLGIGGVEELLSEDEDIEEDIGGEELYEELETDNLPPPIPSSPRPSGSPVPDDIIIDEDIYEDTDDYRQDFNIQESPVHAAPPPALPGRNPPKMMNSAPPPALPDRNPPKISAPAPTLPPRNAPPKSSGPTLPPRGAKQEPQQYEQTAPTRPPAKLPAKAPAKLPTPAPDIGGEEIYDDVIPGGGDDQEAEIEETYDDVVVGESDVMEETYDDVVSATTSVPGKANEPEPITEEFYEDMAPGTGGEGPQEDYVVMEPGEDIGGEELYVDVDTPTPARTTIAPSQPKPIEHEADNKVAANSPRLKSGTFSRMFKGKPASPQPERKATSHGQSVSGTVGHKPPKKNKFEERWAVVEGNFLIIYKNSSAKSHQEKLPLSECGLDMGSPDVGPGEHAFRITARGDRVHHFKLKAKLDFDKWVTVIKGLTKYAPIETVERGEQQVYQAMEDHIGENAGELTFKKGTYIRLISKDADNEWVGQIGNEAQVFEGKIGKFPMSKVTLAEDLYI